MITSCLLYTSFLSVLKKKRYGDKWNGLSIADAKEDIKTGYEDYYFEFEPWEVEAIIEYPTARDGRKYFEDELKDILAKKNKDKDY